MRTAFVLVAAATATNQRSCAKVEKKALLQNTNPGAGHKPLPDIKAEVGMQAYQDAYFHVSCMSDAMQKNADMHSVAHKVNYAKWADHAEVSVVRYATVVPKTEQEPMTPNVCYSFCRTVPDMQFFGITNGRDCYCTPYFKAGDGDSSDCDAPCDGDVAQTCGGKLKSDIWQMHSCNDLEQQVSAAKGKMQELVGKIGGAMEQFFPSSSPGGNFIDRAHCPDQDGGNVGSPLLAVEDGIAAVGKQLFAMSKKNADPSAGTNAQRAFEALKKVNSGMIRKACNLAERHDQVKDDLMMADPQSKDPAAMMALEAVVAQMDAINSDAVPLMDLMEEVGPEFLNVHIGESPEEADARHKQEDAAFETYYRASDLLTRGTNSTTVSGSVHEDTCQGKLASDDVRFYNHRSECAAACMRNVSQGCIAFQWFTQCDGFMASAQGSGPGDHGAGNACGGLGERGLCTLLKEVNQVSMYTKDEGCQQGAAECWIGAEGKKGFGHEQKTAENQRCFAEV